MSFGFIGDIVGDAFDFVGDTFEWAGEKVSDAWDSDIGRLAIIAGVGYAAYTMMGASGAAAAVEGETAIAATAAAEGTGVVAAGAETIAASEVGALAGTEALSGEALAAEIAGMDAGAIDLTLAGGAESGALAGMETAAGVTPVIPPVDPINPMLQYGGMMAGGQVISGYMEGKALEEAEARRLEEEEAARNRQNVWGVNYAAGGQPISAADRLQQLNRQYFDSAAPVAQGQDQYALRSDRERQGVLNELTSIARPAEQYRHRT